MLIILCVFIILALLLDILKVPRHKLYALLCPARGRNGGIHPEGGPLLQHVEQCGIAQDSEGLHLGDSDLLLEAFELQTHIVDGRLAAAHLPGLLDGVQALLLVDLFLFLLLFEFVVHV
jgi:hypothetical protein